MKMRALVTGAGGFIGHHLVNRLVQEGYWVRAADCKRPEFEESRATRFDIVDLRQAIYCDAAVEGIDEVYHLASDMGGIGYIGTERFYIATNNAILNSNMLRAAIRYNVKKFFFSSSACVYPAWIQTGDAVNLKESLAWPADPEPGYGLEKLFMEKLCEYALEKGIETRVARFHNIYGPLGTYKGGREKSPAALCRKVAEANDGGSIEVWGDGSQQRSYTYISDCIEGVRKLMDSNCREPINIGSDEAISISDLTDMIIGISGKSISKNYNALKPVGVHGRNSENTKIKEILQWSPSTPLREGMAKTYEWIDKQVKKDRPKVKTAR